MLVWFYLILCAAILALLEIQIEGKDGWAKNLPTWRITNPVKVVGWPYLDGYHIYLWLLLLLLFQLPILFGFPLSFHNELTLFRYLLFLCFVEDFLWFVFSPHWGLKKFFKQQIPWQRQKLLFLPVGYWLALLIWGFLWLI